jgi:predicted transcriptional regulator
VRAPNEKVGEYVNYIFNFKISDDMRGDLKQFAAMAGVSQSQVCRDALRLYIGRYIEPPSTWRT